MFSNSRSGFTLIETIVVLAIGVFLFGLTIAYNRSSNDQLLVFTEQARIVGFLNRAKSFALEKRTGLAADICAFGIHFQPPVAGLDGQGSFILFQDLPNDGLSCPDGANGEFDGLAEQREVLPVDAKVEIEAFPGNVVFEPPYLQTSYAANYNELGLVKISVAGGFSSCAAVGPGGAVYSLECPDDFMIVQ